MKKAAEQLARRLCSMERIVEKSMDLYLVTGFLGAGKTTFLKRFLPLLSDQKLALVVNEFGREGVDGVLLRGLGVALSEINNGSVFCSCRSDLFEAALAELSEGGFSCVVTETSGLSDPGSIGAILKNNPALEGIVYRGCICLADAKNFHKVLDTAAAVKSQIAACSLALINKTDLAEDSELACTREKIASLNPDCRIEETSFGAFQREWLGAVHPINGTGARPPSGRDLTQQKYTVTLSETISEETLYAFLAELLPESDRVKGFLLAEGKRLLVNCVEDILEVEPDPTAFDEMLCGKLVILSAGGKRTRTALKHLRERYGEWILNVEAL